MMKSNDGKAQATLQFAPTQDSNASAHSQSGGSGKPTTRAASAKAQAKPSHSSPRKNRSRGRKHGDRSPKSKVPQGRNTPNSPSTNMVTPAPKTGTEDPSPSDTTTPARSPVTKQARFQSPTATPNSRPSPNSSPDLEASPSKDERMAVEDPPEVVRHSKAASTLKAPPTTVVCKVNRRQKPTPHWSRATQGIRVTDFKPIQREAFLHPVKDSELPGIKAIFQSTRLAKQVATETMEETTYEEIVSSAMAPSMDSSNAFFFQDLEDQGKANKAAFLRFMVRLGNTPVENLPNWDAADGAIINPSFWERMWYEVYKRFGAVGTINVTLKTVAASPRRSPAASAGTSDLFPPLHNAPPPGDARTRPLNPYIAKGKKK